MVFLKFTVLEAYFTEKPVCFCFLKALLKKFHFFFFIFFSDRFDIKNNFFKKNILFQWISKQKTLKKTTTTTIPNGLDSKPCFLNSM
jgi:hypothetical protein